MTLQRKRAIVMFALVLAAALAGYVWKPTQHLSDMRSRTNLEQMFPKSFGEWVVDERMPVQLVSPDQQALLNKIYNQTLSRTYTNAAGERIMLSVAYGGDQSDGTRAHRPEVCYPAQGFQIQTDSSDKLMIDGQRVPARLLVARQGARIEPITYWVVVGERVALSGPEQKFAQLAYSVRGIVPDGMLVRVSTIDADSKRAYALQHRFLSSLAAAIDTSVKARVFGRDEA